MDIGVGKKYLTSKGFLIQCVSNNRVKPGVVDPEEPSIYKEYPVYSYRFKILKDRSGKDLDKAFIHYDQSGNPIHKKEYGKIKSVQPM